MTVGFDSAPVKGFAENKIPQVVEERLVHLLAIGAIDAEDAELVRARWSGYPPGEWLALLDACERAAKRR